MSGLTKPSFREAFLFWLKLGWISFGGPSGQIAIMHEELVSRKKWIEEDHFLHALNYCMFLPGPEAQQLTIYIGWLLHRTWGGIVAGVFFILPSIFILWTLSYVYVAYGKIAWVASLFYGLKPAVMAVVGVAVIRIGRSVLKNYIMWSLAALAFVSIFFFHVSFPIIILSAAIIGLFGGKFWKKMFLIVKNPESSQGEKLMVHSRTRPTLMRSLKVIFLCVLLWIAPIVLAGFLFGWESTLVQEGVFFSKAALVTFGGAYAVLPYVAQQSVEKFHWLTPTQMLDGLGFAETTPGPLIMVLQFVGFLGAWNHSNGLNPLFAATGGALMTTWCTFEPCFLWIFLGAPYIERLRGNTLLTCALTGITAAVVGVILNLAVWFGMHVLFPTKGHVDMFSFVVSLIAFLGIWLKKWNIVWVIMGSCLLGLAYYVAM